MPFVYFGSGWLIGIGFVLWQSDRRARRIWISVFFAIGGGIWFTLRSPRFDQNSLSTYNGIGQVTIDGVIDADPMCAIPTSTCASKPIN